MKVKNREIAKVISINGINSVIQKYGADAKFMLDDKVIQSIDPAETCFGFTVHSHMVPPFRPEKTLMLGYGAGTVPELMRKIWGSGIKIVGVDKEIETKYIEFEMKQIDGYEYVKYCADSDIKLKFDYICVDLWEGSKVMDFIFESAFASRLKEICKEMLCINCPTESFKNMRAYYDYGFKFLRHVNIGGNTVSWWMV